MISYPQRVANIDTRMIEAGRPGSRAIVLVHGTGGRADRWNRNVDALAAAGFHVLAFDLPGHGFASKGAGLDCSVPGYRKFLADLLDVVKIDKPVIVGTSLGGHVVASFACEQPERVSGSSCRGSMGLVPLGAEARGRVEAGANNQTYEGVKGKLARVIFDPVLVTQDFIDEEFRINNSHGARESFGTLGRYIGQKLDDDVVGDRLAKLTPSLPTLLLWGAEDKTVPLAVGEAAARKLPGSRLVVLHKVAHTSYYERPDDFNNVVRRLRLGRARPSQGRWRGVRRMSDFIVNGTLIDGTGAAPTPLRWIEIVDGRIAEVVSGPANAGRPLPADANILFDARDRTVMPGLVDSHCHISYGVARGMEEQDLYASAEYRAIRAMWHAGQVLRSGVTAICDPGGSWNVAIAARDAIKAGMFEGPRIAAAARYLTSHTGLADYYPTWVGAPKSGVGALTNDVQRC